MEGLGVHHSTTEEKRDAWVFYTDRFAEEADTPEAIALYLGRPGPRQLLIEDELLKTVEPAALSGEEGGGGAQTCGALSSRPDGS